MHHVLARITVKPESADDARKLLQELVVQSRKGPGCVSYALYQQTEAPHIFQTVEEWKQKSDADAHMGTPHLAAAVAAATPMFTAPPEIVAWNRVT